ncbi:MAG: arginine--tRNA ligase, partial [Thermoplasmata archaeon]|nr:arginine--tRNA ligase [Thermoplasmata archaeon]
MDPSQEYSDSFKKAVADVFARLDITGDPVIEAPRSGEADRCLVCFPLARELGGRPDEISQRIQKEIEVDPRWSLSTQGGYLNCMFDDGQYVRDCASHLWGLGEDIIGEKKKGERLIVEHTSANPNGPFHVGRARNPIIGDSLVRLMRCAGHDVEAQYWINDMGKQVMILVWGLANIPGDEVPSSEREKRDHELVRFYQAANGRMEAEEKVQQEINSMLKRYEEAVAAGDHDRIISDTGSNVVRAREVRSACDLVLEGMKESLGRLNVFMDSFVYESTVVEDGSLKDVIRKLSRSPLCRDENGAKYLDLRGIIKGGEDDRFKKRFVFTRSDGSALYTTRDLAYHDWKLNRCTRAVNVLGEDHRYQSTLLELALKEMGSKRFPEVVFYSFVSLPEGKMSTRRGRVVYLDDLLDEAVDRARAEVLKRRGDLSENEVEEISRTVGIGAIRFNVIKVQAEKKMTFKWEEALSFDGSSAPFI